MTSDASASSLPRWEFATAGPRRERLNGLALAGAKTATFALLAVNEMFGEEPTFAGKRWCMVGTNGAELAVIESTGRTVLPVGSVTWEQVESEGASFVSVDDWRCAHETHWEHFTDDIRKYLGDPVWGIDDSTSVVYETFRVVERLPEADLARYPVVGCVVPEHEAELASEMMIDLGSTGIEELDHPPADHVRLRGVFPSDVVAVRAEAALPRAWRPRFEVVLGDEWLDAWREHFEPFRVGRIVVVPSYRDDVELAGHPVLLGLGFGDVVLNLDPGRAFGTGAHPSSRLVLEVLQQLQLADASMLDVGCGSGVLTIAASLLGARAVTSIDIDSAAVAVTARNAADNGVAPRCRVGDDSVEVVGARGDRFDVVVANILAPVLIEHAYAIGVTVANAGHLVLSGLIASQLDRVAAAYPTFEVEATLDDAPWTCLLLRHRAG